MNTASTAPAHANGAALRFPPNFLWGAATAATQVEGHITNEWTHFVAPDGNTCQIACDHYHRYPEDIDWMVKLGLKAYRMGIEWSRLQSAPYAPLNHAELDRYCDLLDHLQAAGITPMVVLHHFSNPPWISAARGWKNPATVPAFVDYVTKLVAALRSRVRYNHFRPARSLAKVPTTHLHHRTRLRLHRRGLPRHRSPGKSHRPPPRHLPRRGCSRFLLLVVARQLRVAVRLLEKIWAY
jgi:hypothetical protein